MDLARKQRFVIGLVTLLVVDIIWVASSELTKYIFQDIGFNKPFFSTYLKTSLFSLYLLGFLFRRSWQLQCLKQDDDDYEEVNHQSIDDDSISQETSSLGESSFEPLKYAGESEKNTDSDDSSCRSVRFSKMAEVRQMSDADASEATFSRLSFAASLRVSHLSAEIRGKLSVRAVVHLSLVFCFLWFWANYSYQKALSVTEVGIVNVLSSTSSLFTLCLASLFPSSSADRFSLSKLVAVAVMITGIAIISLEDVELEKSFVPLGMVWSLLGALLYACYMVLIRRKVPSEEKVDFTMFFGFVGLFNAVLLWPGFFLLNAFGWEAFQIPTQKQILFMVVNGLIGTVLSELLWLWGCFLTSSLLATLSITLTIPLSMLCDMVLKGVSYSWHFYAGSLPVCASFIAVTILTHYEDRDPVLDAFNALCGRCYRTEAKYNLIADSTEEEELIGNEHDDAFDGTDEDSISDRDSYSLHQDI